MDDQQSVPLSGGVLSQNNESEQVLDDESEEYEEKFTGIKIRFFLKESDIIDALKSTGANLKKAKTNNFYLLIFAFLAIAFFVLWEFFHNKIYLIVEFFPLGGLFLVWFFQALNFKKAAKKLLKNDWFSVEVFHDSIDVNCAGVEKKIVLTPLTKYEETKRHILIYPPGDEMLIIPIKAIDPEYLSDVQAMIFALAEPLYEK
jgi:hypothetical protein